MRVPANNRCWIGLGKRKQRTKMLKVMLPIGINLYGM